MDCCSEEVAKLENFITSEMQRRGISLVGMKMHSGLGTLHKMFVMTPDEDDNNIIFQDERICIDCGAFLAFVADKIDLTPIVSNIEKSENSCIIAAMSLVELWSQSETTETMLRSALDR